MSSRSSNVSSVSSGCPFPNCDKGFKTSHTYVDHCMKCHLNQDEQASLLKYINGRAIIQVEEVKKAEIAARKAAKKAAEAKMMEKLMKKMKLTGAVPVVSDDEDEEESEANTNMDVSHVSDGDEPASDSEDDSDVTAPVVPAPAKAVKAAAPAPLTTANVESHNKSSKKKK